MSVTLQTDLFNPMIRVVGDINNNRDRFPVYVDLVVAYYDFRYEIIVMGALERIGFYGTETRIVGDPHDGNPKQLFAALDDFMSGDERRINLQKHMIDWARR